MKKRVLLLFSLLCFSINLFSASFIIEAENMQKGGKYAGVISSPFPGIGLYANGDDGTTSHAFPEGDGNYLVSLTGASNNTSSAGVSLYINNVKVKAFAFYGTSPSTWDLEIKITELSASNTIKLLLETDNGASDTFIDKITFTYQGPIIVKDPPVLPTQGAYHTDNYRNMLSDAGYSAVEINQKLENLWNQLFYGDPDTQAIYYPVGTDEAYILDTGNSDIRSEGMSYGMMISVQLDKKEEFDRLWKWAKTRMQNADGTQKGYFAWNIKTDGSGKSQHAAPDGDEYFAMALMFAAGRWGSGEGIYNYWKEANYILENSMSKGNLINSSVTNLFNDKEKQVVFVPYAASAKHTDPSYHLPAFYELWSLWANQNRSFWSDLAVKSREMFYKFANSETGLMPDYANFDGTPTGGSHADFRYDAWRCIMNVAMDYSWFKKDDGQVALVNRIHNFFTSQGVDSYGSEYSLVGRKLNSDHSPGLVACNATGALASNQTVAWDFIDDFFQIGIPSGKYRYYDGMLYFMNYLNLSGNYKIYKPREVLDVALDERFEYDDNYLIVDEFESKDINTEYSMRRTESSTGTAKVVASPTNVTEKSLQILPGNYDEFFCLEFTLPKGRTLKDDYSSLEFDIFYDPTGDNAKQDLKIDFDEIKNPPFFKKTTGEKASHGKWENIIVPLDGVTSENRFKLYIGVRTRSANFYIDNLKLKVTYSPPTSIGEDSAESLKKTYFKLIDETLYLNSAVEKVHIYNTDGRLLKFAKQPESINISTFPRGSYILKMETASQTIAEKFMK